MLNRLVLISDGGANAGVTDIELIGHNASYGGSDGIYLVGAGVDLDGTYNDDLIQLTLPASGVGLGGPPFGHHREPFAHLAPSQFLTRLR